MDQYDEKLRQRARLLRGNQTDAEQRLWSRLRRKQVHSAVFNRQKPLDRFIVDFYCSRAAVVIEIDGGQHFEKAGEYRDSERDARLTALGMVILRFDNLQVLQETDAVVEQVARLVESRLVAKGYC